ncbi:probable WRKY transcription factor 30 [Rutidosis leptorrhynchoides]|uniref:probable WRKY transcription factor 30 n=1 Tax=Rutidosis leptorrhynchoides TaxID=125765 RepID=UPI003A99F460
MDYKRVIDELTQGKEFAKQLMIHLNDPMSSKESQETLIHSILNSYDKSLSLVFTTHGFINSNVSKNESKDHEFFHPDPFFDKRKSTNSSIEKWNNQVIMSGDMGLEEALDDGHSWRKYGQKDILGAKHPRGYYRCAYRHIDGCLATKYVQKIVDDPITFDITYRGSHTCNRRSHTELEIQQKTPQQNQVNFQTGRNVGTENIETPSFNFLSTSNIIFSDGLTTSVEKSTNSMVLETELNDIVAPTTSFRRSQDSVDVDYTFGEFEFVSANNFDDLLFFD